MPIKFVLRITATVAAFAIFLVLPATASANSVKKSNAGKLHRLHNASAHVRTSRSRMVAGGNTLPYGPEYGFLSHVPPNAIRMPGYTFVPGVGILGASCDLPTSACSNQYRDIQ
jgi:hypothetical protein